MTFNILLQTNYIVKLINTPANTLSKESRKNHNKHKPGRGYLIEIEKKGMKK